MSVLRQFNVANLRFGAVNFFSIQKFESTRIFARAYAVGSWHVTRLHDVKDHQADTVSWILQCTACHLIQPVRHAWFTKSRLNPKIPPTKPLNFDHSGDLEKELPIVDPMKPKLGYEKCEELKTADEQIQRIFSLGFGSRHDRKEYLKHELLSRVSRHENDFASQEARIARLTLKIRTQIDFCLKFRKDKLAKCKLNNDIQTRNRFLKELQMSDRPKFLQVCEALQVKYIPVVREEDYVPKFHRPQMLNKAKLEGEAIRKEKLRALEEKLAKEREEFYAEKELMMKQIEADLEAMGVDGQVMMNEIFEKERKQERWLNSKWYKFLQRFPPVQKKYVTMKVQQ